jgi:hypothetical protein
VVDSGQHGGMLALLALGWFAIRGPASKLGVSMAE